MASYLGNMMGMQSTPDDDGEQPRESSLFSLQGGLDETLGSLLGAWQRENPTKLQDVDASWRTSVLHLTQPESEERFLEAQEEGDDDAPDKPPPPVDTSSLPATFHVVPKEKRTKIAADTVDGASVAQFWRVAYADDSKALRTQFLEGEMKCWNVVIGRWAPHPELGIARMVTYEVDTHAPVGPQQTRVLEYEAVDRDSDLTRFTHRSVVNILDATFGDHYQVETTVTATTVGGSAHYEMDFAIHFSKKIPMWGIEGLVKSTWKAKNTASAKCFLGMAKDQLKAAPPSMDRGRSILHTWASGGLAGAVASLAVEAPPPPPPAAGERPVMTGALEKHSRRTIFAHWRRCTLREDGVFLWAKVEGDGRVLGSVSVVGGRVEKVDHDSLDFKVTRENGNWFRFVAKTAAEADKWVYLLEKAARGDAAPPTPPCKKRGVNGVPRRYSSPRL